MRNTIFSIPSQLQPITFRGNLFLNKCLKRDSFGHNPQQCHHQLNNKNMLLHSNNHLNFYSVKLPKHSNASYFNIFLEENHVQCSFSYEMRSSVNASSFSTIRFFSVFSEVAATAGTNPKPSSLNRQCQKNPRQTTTVRISTFISPKYSRC